MHIKKLIFGFLLVLSGSHFGFAQILDDSTKQIYGPETSRYFYENDIKYGTGKTHSLDTLIEELHNYNYVNRHQNKMQDLGNIGTAIRPLFYIPPTTLGMTSGFHAYDLYYRSPETIKYYDTKSPYSRMYHVIGGNGRGITEVDYSRNINPQWNIGGTFRRMAVDKQFGARLSRGDRHVESNAYHFYTSYKSKNNKYHLLGHFSRMGHKVKENGGISPGTGPLGSSVYSDNARVNLNQTSNGDLRIGYHLYQQYKISENLQVYHTFDKLRQAVNLNVADVLDASGELTEEGRYFDRVLFPDRTLTNDVYLFKSLSNELGLKGNMNHLFYNVYYRRRDVKFNSNNFDTQQGYQAEHYLGSNLRYTFNSGAYSEVFGEYMLNGNYRTGFVLRDKNAQIQYTKSKYAPSFLQQNYQGNHHAWENNFESINSDHVDVSYGLNTNFLSFRPHFSFTNLQNQVVFNNTQRPVQVGGVVQVLSPGVDLNLTFFKRFHLDNTLIYSKVLGSAVNTVRLPELFANSRIYYSNYLFNKKLQLQTGVDLHARSAYFAMGYTPVTQQFYLQNKAQVQEFVTADFFVNMKINRTTIFLKMVNVNQGLPYEGYMLTPHHPGQRRTFDFGFNWMFFD